MRKFFLFALLLLTLGVSARPYDHSLGFVGGNFNGFSYKYLSPKNFAIQTDLGVEVTVFDGLYGIFKVNPMAMYQVSMYENHICSIDWFCGGGPSLGFMTLNLDYDGYGNFGGEFGLNAILGIEFAFSKALALSFDFRPGYGLFFGSIPYTYTTSNYNGSSYYTTTHTNYWHGAAHFFDWGLQLGLRFYL